MTKRRAAISRQPSGSPSTRAPKRTPTTGTMTVPMAAIEAGNKLTTLYQAYWQNSIGSASV